GTSLPAHSAPGARSGGRGGCACSRALRRSRSVRWRRSIRFASRPCPATPSPAATRHCTWRAVGRVVGAATGAAVPDVNRCEQTACAARHCPAVRPAVEQEPTIRSGPCALASGERVSRCAPRTCKKSRGARPALWPGSAAVAWQVHMTGVERVERPDRARDQWGRVVAWAVVASVVIHAGVLAAWLAMAVPTVGVDGRGEKAEAIELLGAVTRTTWERLVDRPALPVLAELHVAFDATPIVPELKPLDAFSLV